MNVYSLGALIVVWSTLTRTTATVAGMHVPVVWLLVAAVVLSLAAMVLLLARTLMRDGGWWVAYPCHS